MSELLARDTISGQRGKAYATIDGSREELFYVKNLEATFNKDKVEVKTLGYRGTQHKAVGWSGSGSLTAFYMSSLFRRMAIDFIKTGKDVYFTLLVTNEDDSSTVGKQTTALYNCNIDSTVLAKLDTESSVLEEDMDFTFDGAELLDEFGKPV